MIPKNIIDSHDWSEPSIVNLPLIKVISLEIFKPFEWKYAVTYCMCCRRCNLMIYKIENKKTNELIYQPIGSEEIESCDERVLRQLLK